MLEHRLPFYLRNGLVVNFFQPATDPFVHLSMLKTVSLAVAWTYAIAAMSATWVLELIVLMLLQAV